MSKSKLRAYAKILGDTAHPNLRGNITFQSMFEGVLVTAYITGLPIQSDYGNCGVFGFHIHSGGSCTGNEENEFENAEGHFNPDAYPHPYHAGDMPPLFACNGVAYLSFLTNRFTLEDILGRTVIVHQKPDDFTTQPSGNAGEMIACGVIN